MSIPDAARANPVPQNRIIIIGGGASGVLLAAQVLRQSDGPHVTIIEQRGMLGCGLAYSTTDPEHLLNSRASNMSGFPDQPDHFVDWLHAHDHPEANRFSFVSRATYGRYMASLLAPWVGRDRLSCAMAECTVLEEQPGTDHVVAHLANGSKITGKVAVLATGHVLPGSQAPFVSQPWDALPPEQRKGRVLIVGSGLTMVDQVLSLLNAGHRGEIITLSRRGVLPQAHKENSPLKISADDLPIGQGIANLMRWLRRLIARHEAAGGDWRDVLDGLRPHIQAIWRGLPLDSRRSFLRHGSTLWEVHRHRMPPCSADRIRSALATGQLRSVRGSFQSGWRDDSGQLQARYTARSDGKVVDIAVVRIIDCRGIRRDPETNATPLFADLLQSGRARVDPLRIGLDVGVDGEVLDADGAPSTRIFTIGPASRAALWEITAIPDIREQAARIARSIISSFAGAGQGVTTR